MSDIEKIMTMNEEEIEELPTEEKKKAINLQDLIYVKHYINNMNAGNKEEIINEVNTKQNAFEDGINTNINDFKEEVNNDMDSFKDGVNADIEKIVDGTTEVGKATTAKEAETAGTAGHADSADKATNADNAVCNSDGTYTKLIQTDNVLSVDGRKIVSQDDGVDVTLPRNTRVGVDLEPGYWYEFEGMIYVPLNGGTPLRSYFSFKFFYQSYNANFTQYSTHTFETIRSVSEGDSAEGKINNTVFEKVPQQIYVGSSSTGKLLMYRSSENFGETCMGKIRRIYS